MGGLALGSMLPNTAAASSLSVTGPQFKPKAKRVIHIFLNGGPSHVGTVSYTHLTLPTILLV